MIIVAGNETSVPVLKEDRAVAEPQVVTPEGQDPGPKPDLKQPTVATGVNINPAEWEEVPLELNDISNVPPPVATVDPNLARRSLQNYSDKAPEDIALTKRVSDQNKIPFNFVEQDLGYYRKAQQDKERADELLKLRKDGDYEFLNTARWVSKNPIGAGITRDEISLLQKIEGSYQRAAIGQANEGFISQATRGFASTTAGLLKNITQIPGLATSLAVYPFNKTSEVIGSPTRITPPEALTDNFAIDFFTQIERDLAPITSQASITQQIKDEQYKEAAKNLGVSVIANLPTLLGMAGASAAGIGAKTTLAALGTTVAAGKQADALAEGKDPNVALQTAIVHGTAEAAFETVTLGWLKRLSDPIVKTVGKDAARRVALEVGGNFLKEGASEGATQIVQDLADYAAGDKLTVNDFSNRFLDAFIVGGALGGGVTAIAASAKELNDRTEFNRTEQKHNIQLKEFEERAKVAAESNARKIAPEVFESHSEQVAQDLGANTTAQISKEAIDTLYQNDREGKEKFLKDMEIEEQYNLAQQTGQDITLSQIKLITKYAGTSVLDAIKNDLSFTGGGLTENTKNELKSKLEKDIAEAKQTILDLKDETELPTQLQTLREDLIKPRKEGGLGLKAADADAQISVALEMARGLAKRRDETTQEFFNRVNLKVNIGGEFVQGRAGEPTLKQEAPKAPGLRPGEIEVDKATLPETVTITELRDRAPIPSASTPAKLKEQIRADSKSLTENGVVASLVDSTLSFNITDKSINNLVDGALAKFDKLTNKRPKKANATFKNDILAIRNLPFILENAVLYSKSKPIKTEGGAQPRDHYKALVRLNGRDLTVDIQVASNGDLVGLKTGVAEKAGGVPAATGLQGEPEAVESGTVLPPDIVSISEFERRVKTTLFQEDVGPKDGDKKGGATEGIVRGSITLGDGETVIRLFNSANMSTLMHEFGHLWFAEAQKIINEGLADEQLIKDWETIKEFAGKELSVEGQEKFTRAFEAYLREGKAPSVKLTDAFARIRKWMLDIYNSIRGLDVELNDEIREVFDRMLAAQSDIEEAKEYYNSKQKLEELIPVTKNTEEKLTKKRDKAEKSNLDKQIALAMDAYFRMRGGEDALRVQAGREIDSDPRYKTLANLITNGGINASDVESIAGKNVLKEIRRLHPGLVVKDGGIDIGEAAVNNEVQSDQALIQQLLETETREKAVQKKFEELRGNLEAQFRQEFENTEQVPGDTAFHTDERIELLLEEEAAIRHEADKLQKKNKKAGVEALSRKILNDFAQDLINRSSVQDATRPDRFSNAAKKWADKYAIELERGALVEAHEAKKKQIINHLATNKAIQARDLKNKIEDRYSTSKLKSKTKTIENEYREVVLNLTNAFGLNTHEKLQAKDPLAIPDISKLDKVLAQLTPDFVKEKRLGKGVKNYLGMKFEDFVRLDESIQSIIHYGRDALSTIESDEFSTIQEAADASIKEMNKLKDKEIYDEFSIKGRVLNKVDGLLAHTEMTEFLFEHLDNFKRLRENKFGPLRQFFNRGIKAETDFQALKKKAFDLAKPHWEMIYKAKKRLEKEFGGISFSIEGVPVTEEMRKVNRFGWTVERMVAFALNTGTESNLSVLQSSFSYTDQQVNKILSYFTKEELEAIQGVWDATNSLFEDLDNTHFRIYNRHIEKVEAKSKKVELANGEEVILRGGYYPLQFDHVLSDRAGKIQEENLMENRSQAVFRSTKPEDGFTLSRKPGVSIPPRLELGVWFEHITDTSRYISHAEYVRDLNRLTTNKDWRRVMRDKAGRESYTVLRDWVQFQARPERRLSNAWERFLDNQRKLSTTAILGANLSIGIKQRTALAVAASEIGWKWVINGFKQMSAKTSLLGLEGSEQWDKVKALSPYMRAREGNIDRELADAVNKMDPLVKRFEIAGKQFTWRDVQDFMFAWIQMNDRATVAVVWIGAFNKHMSENSALEEKERTAKSIEFADAIIRETQASTLPLDLNSLQRTEGTLRMFTSFMTWMFRHGNRLISKHQAYKEGAITTKQYLSYVMNDLLLAPWGSLVIGTLISSGDLPEWWEFFITPVENAVSWIPFVRDISGAVRYDKDFGTLPAMSAANEVLKAGKTTWQFFEGDKEFNQVLWDVSNATTVQLGVPAVKVMKNMKKTSDMIENKK